MIPAVVQFAVFHQTQTWTTSQVPHPNQVEFHPSIQILILTLTLILPIITLIINECKLSFYSLIHFECVTYLLYVRILYMIYVKFCYTVFYFATSSQCKERIILHFGFIDYLIGTENNITRNLKIITSEWIERISSKLLIFKSVIIFAFEVWVYLKPSIQSFRFQ
jgi:hypothetical protein